MPFQVTCHFLADTSLQKKKTTTIAVEVKKSQHKYIIGPKGNTLQEILDTTGVSVEMPPLESSSETIILRGEPDKLGPALTQVYAKVSICHGHIKGLVSQGYFTWDQHSSITGSQAP